MAESVGGPRLSRQKGPRKLFRRRVGAIAHGSHVSSLSSTHDLTDRLVKRGHMLNLSSTHDQEGSSLVGNKSEGRFKLVVTKQELGRAIWRVSWQSDLTAIQQQLLVNTKYKRKADKVVPVNRPDPTGAKPAATSDWREKVLKKYYSKEWSVPKPIDGPFQAHVIPKISGIYRGARLVPEQVD